MSYDCCWFNPERNPLECPNIEEGEEYLYASPRKRFVEKCIDCQWFQRDLASIPDKNPLKNLILTLREEYKEQKGHLQSLSAFLSSKSREIKFLHELSLVLQTSMELDEVLSVAMTAITSGKGFGMNRAFLLMVDREKNSLVGHLGVGPKDYEEAWRIWDEVDRSNFSLAELSKEFYKSKLATEKAKFQDVLEQLTVSLDDDSHIFNRALRERRAIHVENAFDDQEIDRKLVNLLGVSRFLVMPLISRNRSIGILLTDNFVTNKPISPRDLQSLQTFAFPVAFAIERASLYERLQEEVDKQTQANRKLQEQQALIVKMEQMAVVGRITASIAHSIRNPLAAIGGFARHLLKSGNPDEKREYLEHMVAAAKQLDDVLEEVFTYSESLHPVMDQWDLNQLAATVADAIRPKLDELQLLLELDLTEGMPKAWLDYKQISFCLRAIILHIAASQQQGGVIRLESSADGSALRLCVLDSLNSLSADDRSRLMTPFSEMETLGEGGGLALCMIILERHGSVLTMEDIAGGGTKYCITLQEKGVI